jgi:putative phosphoesterase
VKVAVISDIHGNLLALEAVLKDIAGESPDLVVCLGDLLSGPMAPIETAELLMARNFPTIAGNHDSYLRDRPPGKLGTLDRYVSEQMAPRHFSWLRTLPGTLVVNEDIFMVHGTPHSDEQPWLDTWSKDRTTTLPDELQVTAEAEGAAQPVILCGHTHIPRLVRLSGERLVLNPGAVGLQFNLGAPDARYALLTRRNGRWEATFRAIPYDWDTAAELAVAHGFPQWRKALTTGWVDAQGLF